MWTEIMKMYQFRLLSFELIDIVSISGMGAGKVEKTIGASKGDTTHIFNPIGIS